MAVTMRMTIRIAFLALAAVVAMQAIPHAVQSRTRAEYREITPVGHVPDTRVTGRTLSVVLPALSPIVAISAATAAKSISWVCLLGVPLLVMGGLRGRWFCRRLCPTGLVAEMAGKWGPGVTPRLAAVPRIGGFLALFTLGGAVAGYPVFLWLDPLCVFNGFFSSWHLPLTGLSLVPSAGLFCIVGMNLWLPNVWCYRLCPLGFTLDWLGVAGRRLRHRSEAHSIEGGREQATESGVGRRQFFALVGGGVAGAAGRMLGSKHQPIRPPGALAEDQMVAVCVRCGNCVRACPAHIISPDLGASGVAGLLTPVLRMDPGYCFEECNECTKVCPTGSLARLSLADKQCVALGVAMVDKSSCLAWAKSQACRVCEEFCRYRAIRMGGEDVVPCPEVDEHLCRGCGVCQTVCPAEKRAVVVQGRPQRRLPAVQLMEERGRSHDS